MDTISSREDWSQGQHQLRRYNGGARRSSATSPTRARRGDRTMRHIAAWTWWADDHAGRRAHSGGRRACRSRSPQPVGPSPAPGHPAQDAAREHAVAARLADHLVPGPGRMASCPASGRGAHGDVETDAWPRPTPPDGRGARIHPPRGPRSPARRASDTRCRPTFSARAATVSRRVGSRCAAAAPASTGGGRGVASEEGGSRRARPVAHGVVVGAYPTNRRLTIDLGQPVPPR